MDIDKLLDFGTERKVMPDFKCAACRDVPAWIEIKRDLLTGRVWCELECCDLVYRAEITKHSPRTIVLGETR